MIMISSIQELKEMVRKVLLELQKESPEVFTNLDALTDALVKRLEKYFVTKTEFAETIDKVMAKIDARFDAMDKRFDAMQKEMDRRFEEMNKRFEAMDKRFEALQKEMDRRFEAMQKEMDRRFEESNRRFEALQKEMDRRFELVDKRFEAVENRLDRIEDNLVVLNKTVQKLGPAIEEDAQETVKYYLDKEGITIPELSNLRITIDNTVVEIDVYGANDEYCVIGEATGSLGQKKFKQLENAIETLKKYAPEKLRPKIIRVLYTEKINPGQEERARKENIWLIKAGKELVPLKEVLQKL
jgi:hypothetical protein